MAAAAATDPADPAPRDTVPRIERIALFKNGLGYATAGARLPDKAKSVRLGQLPVPSYGTFWVSYPKEVKVRSLVTAMETIEELATAPSVDQLLRLNPGRKVLIYATGAPTAERSVIEGVLQPVLNPAAVEPASPYFMDVRRPPERGYYTGYPPQPQNTVRVGEDRKGPGRTQSGFYPAGGFRRGRAGLRNHQPAKAALHPHGIGGTSRLVNAARMPLTTAVAQFVKDGQFVGQDTCYYTSAGSEASIRINRAMNVQAEQAELEVERKRNAATFYGWAYDLVKLSGELKIRNRLDKAIKLEITKELSGEVLQASDAPRDVPTARGLKQVNPKHVLTWLLELKPDEERKVTYSYQLYIRP